MKKTYFYAAALALWCGTAMGQLNNFQGVNFGDRPKPVPSLSSFATYTDSPPSIATGIPDISVPLVQLPGIGTNLGIQLDYNPLDASGGEGVGECGMGWSMFKGGVISRKIEGIVDEIFQNAANPEYEKNIFDDEYYYNLPGISGKFKIERNIEQNTFSLIDQDPRNNVKIAYTKENNDATLVINSFTITDDQGNTYYFNDFSLGAVYDSYYTLKNVAGHEYKSAFFLTRITDANGIETAAFTYEKNSKYDGSAFLYTSCRLKKISTTSGNIEIVYDYDETLEKTLNDPYSIKKVILNNQYTKVAEYILEYSFPQITYTGNDKKRRRLDRIKKMDGQNVLEETSFLYNPPSADVEIPNPCGGSGMNVAANTLKKIIYPTKGAIEYAYSANEVFSNRNDPKMLEAIMEDYTDPCIQKKNRMFSFKYNTADTLEYTFTIPGDPLKKKAFWVNYADIYTTIDPDTGLPVLLPPVPENQRITYTLKKGGTVLASNQKGGTLYVYDFPGNYTVEAKVKYYVDGEVHMGIDEVVLKPGPYRNGSGAKGFRLGSVKRYKDAASDTPDKITTYSYEDFILSNSSSGVSSSDNVIYKNVKVTEGTGNGYTKYYFKTYNEYPPISVTKNGVVSEIRPYDKLMKSGMLDKREIYSEDNKLLSSEKYDYTFVLVENENVSSVDLKDRTAYISTSKNRSTVYPSGTASSFLQTSNETNIRGDNYKPSLSKSIDQEGNVTETFYKYAQDKNQTRLLEANMTGVLLESEVKENGKTIGKSETKFDNGSHLYPSSVIGYNRQTQAPVTTSTLDVYDSKGNLVQATGKNGIPSTTIWGYNQTIPIAVIAGASYAQVASLSSVTAAIAASDADNNNPANEPALLLALDTLRKDPALKEYSITTSTYDPLIGITNSISANGIRTTNVYDTAGRLIKVKDSEGKTLQENQYNYKH